MAFIKKRIIIDIILISILMAGILFFNGGRGQVKAGTGDIYQNLEIFTEVLRFQEDAEPPACLRWQHTRFHPRAKPEHRDARAGVLSHVHLDIAPEQRT